MWSLDPSATVALSGRWRLSPPGAPPVISFLLASCSPASRMNTFPSASKLKQTGSWRSRSQRGDRLTRPRPERVWLLTAVLPRCQLCVCLCDICHYGGRNVTAARSLQTCRAAELWAAPEEQTNPQESSLLRRRLGLTWKQTFEGTKSCTALSNDGPEQKPKGNLENETVCPPIFSSVAETQLGENTEKRTKIFRKTFWSNKVVRNQRWRTQSAGEV